MPLKDRIFSLRTSANMTREQFADAFGVSRQSVMKWENGTSYPEIPKLIEISKRFDISLDALILDRDMRAVEEIHSRKDVTPNYANMHIWEQYTSAITEEYRQAVDEGLDIEAYKDIFASIAKLPQGAIKEEFGDIIFEIITEAKIREDYPYIEPSALEEIRALRKPYSMDKARSQTPLEQKIQGAWVGRVCGCLLGKCVECIHTDELIPLLKNSNNYPMHRYILKSDIDRIDVTKYQYGLMNRPYADTVDGMPVDDDTNYTVLAQKIIDDFGRDFTPQNVLQAWIRYQSKEAYCTAERVAFCNYIKGYEPPCSAIYKNPYREWIGAQIRADYYGYINPGNPELAAEMAWRAASISHVKNGIYGAMFVAAALAAAAVTDSVMDIILSGLAQIPHTSRFYEDVMSVIDGYRNGVSKESCFSRIHEKYDEYTTYGWCHTIPNAMIVVASLLYGNRDYGKSICMAVETGFDTDCNGATVGSILGMANGLAGIPKYWQEPIHDKLHTSIFGVGTVQISEMAEKTMSQIAALHS